ncbi:MAG TPA: hypothetical protein VE221_05535, partial [Sphingomicrobium sp.]|nr:hypothetical protein [Sphingomicrobium sp.]
WIASGHSERSGVDDGCRAFECVGGALQRQNLYGRELAQVLRLGRIALVARNLERAEALRALAPGIDVHTFDFDRADVAFGGAAAIINASPLGMAGTDPMPQSLLDAVRSHAEAATVFDLVTTPGQTEFLAAGESGGGTTVDGLTMLVGQAARAFELFFGVPAPAPDQRLRDLLICEEPK